MANHIIRQGEDKANNLLYAISLDGQGAQKWLFKSNWLPEEKI